MLLDELPQDILRNIYIDLPLEDAINFAHVNKLIFSIFKNQNFWKIQLHIYFPCEAKQIQKSDTNFDYFEYFKFLYKKFIQQDFYQDPNIEIKVAPEKKKDLIRLFNYSKQGNLRGILALRQKNAPKLTLLDFLSSSYSGITRRPAQSWICYLRHQEILDFEYTENSKNLSINTPNSTDLYLASEFNKIQIVELILSVGVHPGVKGPEGLTPLYIAAENGHWQVIKLLLKKGAELDVKSPRGNTALFIASQNGHWQVVELLLSIDVAPDLKNPDGITPLFIAAQEGHLKVVELLLLAGAQANDSVERFIPLYIAAENGYWKIVDLLLSNGAELDVKSSKGFTPLYAAAHNGYWQVVELLLSKEAPPDLKSSDGFTPLYAAAQNGHWQVVEILLSKGAQVNMKSPKGNTPLFIAVKNGHWRVVELLLSANAQPDVKSSKGFTPLYVAAQNGDCQVVKLLLSNSAQPNLKSPDGFTPLHVAAEYGHWQIVDSLLSKSAQPNIKNPSGITPLYIAAERNDLKVVELLLLNKAQPDVKTLDGLTPLYTATALGYDKVVKVLLSHGANLELGPGKKSSIMTPIKLAQKQGHHLIVDLLQHQKVKNEIASVVRLKKDSSILQKAITLYTWYAKQKNSLWPRFEYWRDAKVVAANLENQLNFTQASFAQILQPYNYLLNDVYFQAITEYIHMLFSNENMQVSQVLNQDNTDVNNNSTLINKK